MLDKEHLLYVSAILRYLEPAFQHVQKDVSETLMNCFYYKDDMKQCELDRFSLADQILHQIPSEQQEELNLLLGQKLTISELIQQLLEWVDLSNLHELNTDLVNRILHTFDVVEVAKVMEVVEATQERPPSIHEEEEEEEEPSSSCLYFGDYIIYANTQKPSSYISHLQDEDEEEEES